MWKLNLEEYLEMKSIWERIKKERNLAEEMVCNLAAGRNSISANDSAKIAWKKWWEDDIRNKFNNIIKFIQFHPRK